MRVNVQRDGVPYYCTSQEQLDAFLAAGYTVVEEEPKKAVRKTKKDKA